MDGNQIAHTGETKQCSCMVILGDLLFILHCSGWSKMVDNWLTTHLEMLLKLTWKPLKYKSIGTVQHLPIFSKNIKACRATHKGGRRSHFGVDFSNNSLLQCELLGGSSQLVSS